MSATSPPGPCHRIASKPAARAGVGNHTPHSLEVRIVKQPNVIAPSILSADITRLGDEMRSVLAAGADRVRFDPRAGRIGGA